MLEVLLPLLALAGEPAPDVAAIARRLVAARGEARAELLAEPHRSLVIEAATLAARLEPAQLTLAGALDARYGPGESPEAEALGDDLVRFLLFGDLATAAAIVEDDGLEIREADARRAVIEAGPAGARERIELRLAADGRLSPQDGLDPRQARAALDLFEKLPELVAAATAEVAAGAHADRTAADRALAARLSAHFASRPELFAAKRQDPPRIAPGKDTTWFVGPRLPDGDVDHGAALNRRRDAVPSAQNAALPLAALLGLELHESVQRRLGAPPPGPRLVEDPPENTLRGPWTVAEAPAVALWLEQHAAALDAGREATGRAHFWLPLPEGVALGGVPAPALARLRTLATGLRLRAQGRVGRGDVAAATADVGALLRLASLLDEQPGFLPMLVAAAVRAEAGDACVALAASRADVPAAELRRLLAAARAVPAPHRVADELDSLRVDALSGLIALSRLSARRGPRAVREFLDPGGLGLFQVPSWLLLTPPSRIDWEEALRCVNRWFDGAQAVLQSSGAARDAARQRLDAAFAWRASARVGRLPQRAASDPVARAELGRLLAASLTLDDGVLRDDVTQHGEARFQLGLVALAAAAARAEQGRYPPGAELPPNEDFRLEYRASPDGSRFACAATPLLRGNASCADSTGRLVLGPPGQAASIAGGTCSLP